MDMILSILMLIVALFIAFKYDREKYLVELNSKKKRR